MANNLTNEQYIEAHLNYGKNFMGWQTASFTCADGYQYTVAAEGTAKSIRGELKSRLLDQVIRGPHPIQP